MNPSRQDEGQSITGDKAITPIARLLERLDNVRPNGKARWTARCPSHTDRSSSLSVREIDDGRVLIHCFAGCATPAVLAAVRLEIQDLFVPRASNSRPVESQRDRQLREFMREHPKADANFFDDWLEYRADGGREIGTPVSRFALEYAATAPSLPDLPGELIAHTRLGLDVPLEHPPFGPKNLETLAFWIADALAPTFAPPKNAPLKNAVQHTNPVAPPNVPLGDGATVQSFDPLAKYQRKIDRLTRGAR